MDLNDRFLDLKKCFKNKFPYIMKMQFVQIWLAFINVNLLHLKYCNSLYK